MPLGFKDWGILIVVAAGTVLSGCSATPISSSQVATAIEASVSNPQIPVEMTVFRGHSEQVVASTFSPDGQLIASASFDNTVKLWNPRTGDIIRTFSVELTDQNYEEIYPFAVDSSSKIAFSENGKVIVLGNGHNSIIAWRIDTGEIVQKLRGRANYAAATAFSPDGRIFANALIDLDAEPSAANFEQALRALRDPARSPFNRASSIGIWEVKTANRIRLLSTSGLVRAIALSANHQLLASVNLQGRLQLWNLADGQLLHQWTGGRAVAISPDHQFVAGDSCGSVKVWNISTGQEVHSFEHDCFIESIVFSSDSKLLAAASVSNETIKLWNLETGEAISTLSSAQVFSIAFSSKGNLLASSNFDNTVRIWEIPR